MLLTCGEQGLHTSECNDCGNLENEIEELRTCCNNVNDRIDAMDTAKASKEDLTLAIRQMTETLSRLTGHINDVETNLSSQMNALNVSISNAEARLNARISNVELDLEGQIESNYDELNDRIDNIIGGDAPSAAEIIDARTGCDGTVYATLGDAIRDQLCPVVDRALRIGDDGLVYICRTEA